MKEDEILRKAKRRVRAKKGFYIHLGVFVSVNVFLFVLNALVTPGFNWAMIAMSGWGIGLFVHFIAVFGLFGLGSKNWEEKEIEREVRRMDRRRKGLDGVEEELELPNRQFLEREEDWNDNEFV